MYISPGDAFENVIFLQTVLEEVQHRNRKIYSRIRKLIDAHPKWHVFGNEHHRSCYVERLAKESPNDRNDRAIRVAARWYSKHLENATTCLLTNDAENRLRALKEELECDTVSEYVKNLVVFPHYRFVLNKWCAQVMKMNPFFKFPGS